MTNIFTLNGSLKDTYDIKDYFSVHAVNNSFLNEYERSSLTALKITTGEIRKKETDEMKMGSLIHCAILEPLHFKDRYVVGSFEKPISPQQKIFCNGIIVGLNNVELGNALIERAYNNSYKNSKDSAKKSLELYETLKGYINYLRFDNDKILITQEEYDYVYNMILLAVEQNKDINKILSSDNLIIEQPIYFIYKDPDAPLYSMLCKCKPDIIQVDHQAGKVTIIDVKTTSLDVQSGFVRDFYNRHYDRQLAFYDHGIRTGLSQVYPGYDYDTYEYKHLVIVIGRGEEVIDTVVYNIDNQIIENAREKIYKLFKDVYVANMNGWWDHPISYYVSDKLTNMPVWTNV